MNCLIHLSNQLIDQLIEHINRLTAKHINISDESNPYFIHFLLSEKPKHKNTETYDSCDREIGLNGITTVRAMTWFER